MSEKIYYFNPGHETAVINGSPFYTAPANVVSMQQELAFLPAWYAGKDDLVLVEGKDSYYSYPNEIFPQLAKPIINEDLERYSTNKISLWGISPQAIHYFEEVNTELDINLQLPQWHKEYVYLNSRQAAKDCLSDIINLIPEIRSDILPQFYTNIEDIANIVNNSTYQLLAKAPYSSSGRGLLWLPATGLTRTENQILHGIIKKQGCVSVEKVLNKQIDFAMEFMADGQGNIDFAGYSLFETNTKGGYERNYIDSQENIEKLLSSKIPLELLESVKEKLKSILSKKYAYLYEGCIGVDMMIYLDNNEYKLHPCIEINMRYNMGYLTIQLSKNFVSPQSQGYFYLDFSPQKGEIYKNHLQMQEKHPLQLENNKITKGYLSLCPIDEDSRYRAYVCIGHP